MKNIRHFFRNNLVSIAVLFPLIITQKECNSGGNSGSEIKYPKVEINENYDISNMGARYNLSGVEVDKDVMTMFVSYSGGCKDHDFFLVSKNEYAKSLPPQLTLYLEHDNKGDACRELKQDTLMFNISRARYPNQTKIILKIYNTDVTTTYEYGNEDE